MKVLTVRPPWSWAIAFAGKDIENRTWGTTYRGPVAILAGKNYDGDFAEVYPDEAVAPPSRDLLTFGAIIAVVDLVDVVRDSNSRWAQREPDLFHWQLANPRLLSIPIPAVGTLGLTQLDDELALDIERALRKA